MGKYWEKKALLRNLLPHWPNWTWKGRIIEVQPTIESRAINATASRHDGSDSKGLCFHWVKFQTEKNDLYRQDKARVKALTSHIKKEENAFVNSRQGTWEYIHLVNHFLLVTYYVLCTLSVTGNRKMNKIQSKLQFSVLVINLAVKAAECSGSIPRPCSC